MEAEEVPYEEAGTQIKAGLFKARVQYLLAGGTLVSVFTPAEQAGREAAG